MVWKWEKRRDKRTNKKTSFDTMELVFWIVLNSLYIIFLRTLYFSHIMPDYGCIDTLGTFHRHYPAGAPSVINLLYFIAVLLFLFWLALCVHTIQKTEKRLITGVIRYLELIFVLAFFWMIHGWAVSTDVEPPDAYIYLEKPMPPESIAELVNWYPMPPSQECVWLDEKLITDSWQSTREYYKAFDKALEDGLFLRETNPEAIRPRGSSVTLEPEMLNTPPWWKSLLTISEPPKSKQNTRKATEEELDRARKKRQYQID
ncbi:MAG: hypothetical protein JKY46_08040 [Robiginitomaculum sp.]|nr:hypothetical protein [Robiginitomaculum sp.]